MGQLDGKVAIVTGASRGLGAHIAHRLAQEGAAVAVSARTLDEGGSPLAGSLTQTVADIIDSGGAAVAIRADLRSAADREALVEQAVEALGPVDILVNNAAVTYFRPVAEFTAKQLELMFAVQVYAPLHLAQLVLPSMRERRTGWILNISSRAALHPALPPSRPALGTVYGMCKAALERFTTGLAAEVFADNVAVNVLSPNLVVPTEGTIFHGLVRPGQANTEPPAVMAEAALALCTGAVAGPDGGVGLTGRVAYSQDLLAELRLEVAPSRSSVD
jgi:NAD(P)-dependent dehydrogenase (short-subunit alcohol dehydrogenase family)